MVSESNELGEAQAIEDYGFCAGISLKSIDLGRLDFYVIDNRTDEG